MFHSKFWLWEGKGINSNKIRRVLFIHSAKDMIQLDRRFFKERIPKPEISCLAVTQMLGSINTPEVWD